MSRSVGVNGQEAIVAVATFEFGRGSEWDGANGGRKGGAEQTLKIGKNNEFSAVERSETYRMNSSARPFGLAARGASRLLTAPARTL